MDEHLYILLVDGNDRDRRSVVQNFREAHLAVEALEVSTCAAALDAVKQSPERFDCAFFDFQLPDGDGLCLLKQVRELSAHLPIIILTEHGDEQTAVDLMKAGAADYMRKERLTPESLAACIHQVIRVAKAEQSAREAQNALRESEERFRMMADSAPVLLWVSGTDAKCSFFNERWLEFTGRTLEQEVGGGWTEEVHPEDYPRCLTFYLTRFEQRKEFQMEYRLRRHDGVYRWILANGVPRSNADGSFAGYIGSCLDITDRKAAEEELQKRQADIAALNERLQRSIRETHHRVRNSLQIIAAMVDMQTMDRQRTISRSDLQQLATHIHMLAGVHALLTEEAKEDGEADHLSAKAVLEQLLPLIQQLAGDHHIEFELQDVRLTARQGTSLAIVANELIRNALKYGRDMVHVGLTISKNDAVLEVADDGPGFPKKFNPLTASHTGLELVESLTRWDLGGQSHYENTPDGGGRVVVTIPLPKMH